MSDGKEVTIRRINGFGLVYRGTKAFSEDEKIEFGLTHSNMFYFNIETQIYFVEAPKGGRVLSKKKDESMDFEPIASQDSNLRLYYLENGEGSIYRISLFDIRRGIHTPFEVLELPNSQLSNIERIHMAPDKETIGIYHSYNMFSVFNISQIRAK